MTYKTGKVAYSAAIMPIGGGGGAKFNEGLPSFESQVAVLPASLTDAGIPTNEYDVNAQFTGSSLNWAYQLNAAYSISDMFSVSLGARLVTAKNSYEGYLKDVRINPNQPAFGAAYNGSTLVSAPQFFTDASSTFGAWSAGASAFVAGLQLIIDGGGENLLLTDGELAGLTAAQIAQIQGLIGAAGQNPAGVDIATAQGILAAAAPVFAAQSQAMLGLAAQTSDKELNASQSGYGISPIIGVNFNYQNIFNLAVKFEYLTQITMTNKTERDDVNMFPDGAKMANDMPSMLSVGFGVRPIGKLNVTGGMHLYFDKTANYGKTVNGLNVANDAVIDKNFWEVAFGVEYDVTDKILVSAGYLRTQTGVNMDYQTDMSHSLNTNSFGFGGRYMVMENLGINAGFMKTAYKSTSKLFTVGPINYEATFKREAMVFAIGFDYSF